MKKSDGAMQTHFRRIYILMVQITTFIPCIHKTHAPRSFGEKFFLPAMYSIENVAFKLKPTSHVNMMKLATAVLWGSKDLWSYIVLFFSFIAVFLSQLSFLCLEADFISFYTSFPCFIHTSLWFHVLH